MIARPVSSGRSGAGMLRYSSHDLPTDDTPQPTTSERVTWRATLGAPTDDVDLAMRIMQGTVADAADLKRRAGVSARGRKVKKPYTHFVLAWAPGEKPTREEMLEACSEALEALGLEEHHALAIAHHDTDHIHVHLIVCTIHPETGRSNALSHSALTLQRWAEDWDRRHGTAMPNRTAAIAARDAFRAQVDDEMAALETNAHASADDQVDQRRQALAAARERARAAYPLPKTQPRRGPGRAARTPAQQARWARLYQRQRQQKTPPDVALEQRRRLSRWHRNPVSRMVDRAREAARDAAGHVATAVRAPARDAAAAVGDRAGRIGRAISATLDEVRDIAREARHYFSPAARARRRRTTAVLRQVQPLDSSLYSSLPSPPTSPVRPAAEPAPGEPPAATAAGFVDNDVEQHEPAPGPPEHLQPTDDRDDGRPAVRPGGTLSTGPPPPRPRAPEHRRGGRGRVQQDRRGSRRGPP